MNDLAWALAAVLIGVSLFLAVLVSVGWPTDRDDQTYLP